MSRKGKIPLPLPKEVKVNVSVGAVLLEGPKGKMSLALPDGIQVESKDGIVHVSRKLETKQAKSNHGTVRAILGHMVLGVTKGHRRDLEIQGVGFRAQVQGQKLVLNLGFSSPIEYEVPKDVKVSVPQPTQIIVEGVDKSLVGRVAANIRDLKRPEPYKGKGIRYLGEVVKRKQGKSVTK